MREGQAAQVGRSHEARKITHDATADRHDQMAALRLALGEPAIYELHRLQRLVRLAGGHDEHVRGDTGGFKRELRAACLPMHTLVCDDVRSGDVENGIDALAKLVDYVPAHPYRVVALGCVDGSGEIGVGRHISLSVGLGFRGAVDIDGHYGKDMDSCSSRNDALLAGWLFVLIF